MGESQRGFVSKQDFSRFLFFGYRHSVRRDGVVFREVSASKGAVFILRQHLVQTKAQSKADQKHVQKVIKPKYMYHH
jgi:hypothetical protein